MRFILIIYLLLGMLVGVVITDPSVKLGTYEALFLAAIHIPFVGAGIAIAFSSKPTNGGYSRGMSPVGWALGIIASYFIGFVGLLIAKRLG